MPGTATKQKASAEKAARRKVRLALARIVEHMDGGTVLVIEKKGKRGRRPSGRAKVTLWL